MDFPISNLDLVIIAGYFLIVFGIGYYISKRIDTGEDLFLAGRSLMWGTIGLSLFASNISSTTLIGLAGDAYSTGIAVSNYEWMAGVVLVFMAFFFIPFFIKSRLTTIPEYLEKRFDVRSRKYFSGLTIITSILIDAAGGIYAGTLVLQMFFPCLPFLWTAFGLALVAGLYTAAGGLAAVVYTDVIQAVILFVGSCVIAFLTFQQFDFSWEAATAALPEGHLSKIHPIDNPEGRLPWLGTLIGVPVLGFYYWGLNQYIVQRVLGAKDLQNARWGALLGGLLKLAPLFIMVLPGAWALTLYPGLEQPDLVFPTLVTELLPVGFVGLVLAGLVAAIMSTIDSTLNAASTLITVDFVQPNKPDMTAEQIGTLGKWVTLVLMIVAALWAPAIREFPGLWNYIQSMLSFLVPPVVAVFLLAVFWPRMGRHSAFITLVGGHVLSFGVFLLWITDTVGLHFTIIAGILTGLCLVLAVGAALAFDEVQAEAKVAGLTWRNRTIEPAEDLPWFKDYRYQSVVVLSLTVVLLIIFW